MADQSTVRKISSFVAPTEEDLAYLESLPSAERLALLQAELEKGIASGLSDLTFDEIIADARSKLRAPRHGNG